MNPTDPPPDPPLPPDLACFFEGSRTREAMLRIDAGGFSDAADCQFFPGSMLLEIEGGRRLPGQPGRVLRGRARILAVGTPADIDRHPAARAALRLSMPACVLIPGLVNAHAHLDLTHVGPRPFDVAAGFEAWIDLVRSSRAAVNEAIGDSVRRGIELSLAGGTVAVGDIAGAAAGGPSLVAWRALRESPLAGVSFLEFFAIGTREAAGLARVSAVLDSVAGELDATVRVRLGLQPHAPNTVSLAAYRAAATIARDRRLPLSTHLAESPQEHELISAGSGPFRSLLERLGLWDDGLSRAFGHGRTPIGHLGPVLELSPFLLAHVNDATDADIEVLVRAGQSVVYCPRASEYFGNAEHFGPHRYREMRARGLRVVLGTDSIINLPPGRCGLSTGGLGVLDEMRLLYRRDGTDPRELLTMATTDAAAALGLDPAGFSFKAGGELAGLVAVPVGEHAGPRGVMLSESRPYLLLVGE